MRSIGFYYICHGSGDAGSCKGGIIVLHEWWGLTDAIQGEAARITNEGGFVTLVPDLYRGKVTDDRETAGHYKVKFITFLCTTEFTDIS